MKTVYCFLIGQASEKSFPGNMETISHYIRRALTGLWDFENSLPFKIQYPIKPNLSLVSLIFAVKSWMAKFSRMLESIQA